MMMLIPRIKDTLGTQDIYLWSTNVISKWIIDHFGNHHEFVWVSKTNCIFRLLGRQTTYQLRRCGKWFEVWRI